MTSINDFYIDEIRIITDDGARFTDITNVLNGASGLPAQTVTDTGLKWVIQVTNGSGSSWNPSTNGSIKLTVCTNTSSDESYDLIYTYSENTSIANNGSIYFGWTGNGATIVSNNVSYSSSNNRDDPTTQEIFLADQCIGGSIAVGTRFRLYVNGVEKERVGVTYEADDNAWEQGNGSEGIPIPFRINGITTASGNPTGLSGAGVVVTGSYTRKIANNLSQNAPTKNDNPNDWVVSIISRLDASAAGDPHITTLAGEHYKFVHIGAFRLLEEVVDGKLLIINGCSENGPARWSHNEYIKKFYIQYGGQSILIDNGFRGQEVTVLENNGIEYTEQKLQFHKTAKRYSGGLNGVTPYTTTNYNDPETDDLPSFKRNEIAFKIKNDEDKVILNIIVQNVNEYNLQPCRIGINLGEVPISKNAKGCIVSKKFVPVCKFDDIKSIALLPELEEKHMELIPEGETNPCLRNTRWR
tara:strand:+ start:45187 stop:46593 length:1407 start_codon:yes stop_codon:yes gene_type:complete